jgi:predicted amidophosphoribosyltransferase
VGLTVKEASDRYANFMRNPAPSGPNVCPRCWTFKKPERTHCYSCDWIVKSPNHHCDIVVPITYSVDGEQMHTELAGYKNALAADVRRHHLVGITAVLWRHLQAHEPCVASAVGVESFPVVTTVPSKTVAADDSRGQLRRMVGNWCRHTKKRYRRALRPTDRSTGEREFESDRYEADAGDVSGRAVLLIDDTWTTGVSAEAAAHALKQAGATHVACVPIGRHVHRVVKDDDRNGKLLDKLPSRFDWDACAVGPH